MVELMTGALRVQTLPRIQVTETACDSNAAWVTLSYRSPDGEEGFPGTVDVNVTYTVSSVDGNQDFRCATPVPGTEQNCATATVRLCGRTGRAWPFALFS